MNCQFCGRSKKLIFCLLKNHFCPLIEGRTNFAARGKREKVPKKADFWSGKRNPCSGNELWALRTTKNCNGLTKFSKESTEIKPKYKFF